MWHDRTKMRIENDCVKSTLAHSKAALTSSWPKSQMQVNVDEIP